MKSHIRKSRQGTQIRVKSYTRRKPRGMGVRIKLKRAGALTEFGYNVDLGPTKRQKALMKAVDKYGATAVWRMLNTQVVFRKHERTGIKAKHRMTFQRDRCWIEKTYKIGDQIC